MRTVITALTLAVALLALAGCGSGDGVEVGGPQGATPAAETGDDGGDGAAGERTTITGTLAGDADLEGGCVWVDAGDERYEVQWPEGWRASTAPIELRGPDGRVVAEGDELEVTGRVRTDMATVCQVGTPFEATDVAVAG